MNRPTKKPGIFAGLVVSLSLLTLQASAQADTTEFRPAKLTYTASKLFISAKTNIQQSLISADQARQELLPLPTGEGYQPKTDQVIKQTVVTDVLGSHSELTVWLNPDGTILQRSSVFGGRKQRYRSYRYFSGGAHSVKRFPQGDAESGQDWTHWSKTQLDDYTLSPAASKLDLTEAESLFYRVNVAPLTKPGDQLTLYLFDTDGVIEAQVEVKDISPLQVQFQEMDQKGSREVKEKIDAIHARLSVKPFEASSKADNFSFLGYNGDVDLYIDPQRRIVVQVSGQYDYVGDVDIRLKQVDFR